jgi:2-(1,2-epoxy-1,2-dihydrophenyl)acetyl-CoA isomerase
MNSPENRNALSGRLRSELMQVLAQMEQDDGVKAIILTGAGKAFCAGGDISSMGGKADAGLGRKRMLATQELIHAIMNLEKPVIAAVNGPAAGAGFSLALACDLVLAARSAVFIQSFVHIGLVPDLGSVYFLTHLLGHHRAKELMLTGERISAEKGYQLGFVNQVVEDGQLVEQAQATAERLAKGPGVAIGLTKAMVNRTMMSQLSESLQLEAFAQGVCLQSEDLKEGVKAFFEKRPPRFSGR